MCHRMGLKQVKKGKKNRHTTFQPGHPRQYYSCSNALSFGERTGSGVFHIEMADSGILVVIFRILCSFFSTFFVFLIVLIVLLLRISESGRVFLHIIMKLFCGLLLFNLREVTTLRRWLLLKKREPLTLYTIGFYYFIIIKIRLLSISLCHFGVLTTALVSALKALIN